MTDTTYTWQEITSQPQVWRETLERLKQQRPEVERFLTTHAYGPMLTIGCGSTHYLALSVAAGWNDWSGRTARALPSSELYFYPKRVPMEPTLLLAFSRSGTTTETLWALEAFRKANPGPVVAVTCYPESPLAREADLALSAPAAQEVSIAQTRSFASMLLLAQALTALAVGGEPLSSLQRLPSLLEDLIGRYGQLMAEIGRDLSVERIFYLGNGPLYGLACEGMLKMKEMSLSYAEAYHFLEFRHGPMSMVDDRTLIVGLVAETAREHQLRVLEDMSRLGARVLALMEDASALQGYRPTYLVEARSGLDDWSRGLLLLPLLQHLAFHRSVAKGLDPDHPTHLTAVIEL